MAKKQTKVPARQAAEVVLLEEGRPMHYREITKVALEKGIVKVRGKGRPNEERTMKTIRSFLAGKATDDDTFVRVDPGVFDVKDRSKAEARVAEILAPTTTKGK